MGVDVAARVKMTREFVRLLSRPLTCQTQQKDQRQQEKHLVQRQSQTDGETEDAGHGFRFCFQPAFHRCHKFSFDDESSFRPGARERDNYDLSLNRQRLGPLPTGVVLCDGRIQPVRLMQLSAGPRRARNGQSIAREDAKGVLGCASFVYG